MRTYIFAVCALLAVAAMSAGLLSQRPLVKCDDSELANVTGGWWFRECDGNTPCELWCHPPLNQANPWWFEYNNGAKTCGSPALDTCDHNVKAECQRRFFWDNQCLSWNGLSDHYYSRDVCSGRTIAPIPYP